MEVREHRDARRFETNREVGRRRARHRSQSPEDRARRGHDHLRRAVGELRDDLLVDGAGDTDPSAFFLPDLDLIGARPAEERCAAVALDELDVEIGERAAGRGDGHVERAGLAEQRLWRDDFDRWSGGPAGQEPCSAEQQQEHEKHRNDEPHAGYHTRRSGAFRGGGCG